MTLETIVAGVGMGALLLYALLGGADFGGGVWTLLANGPRAEAQRKAIERAMGPVWEANHVWLIFLIVLLFSCFPIAFAAISVGLFVPLHLALVGIVLRGSAFVFRSHGPSESAPSAWTRVFGIASVITPVLLGMCLAAITSGHFRLPAAPVSHGSLWRPWLTPFAWCVGALALSVCAYLAAVYLTLEQEEEDVREIFRRKALSAGAATALFAALTLLTGRFYAPRLWSGLLDLSTVPVIGAAALFGLLSGCAVAGRRYSWGRAAAIAEVTLLLLGWAVVQQPFLVYPDLSLERAAAPDASLRFFLWMLLPGGLLLVPSLLFLFAVFKGHGKEAAR